MRVIRTSDLMGAASEFLGYGSSYDNWDYSVPDPIEEPEATGDGVPRDDQVGIDQEALPVYQQPTTRKRLVAGGRG